VKEQSKPWASRIVGHAEVPPVSLTANPRNWRKHPDAQRKALAGALSEVGWVAQIIVNKRTGHVVDGHARVELAVERKEATVPVVYVDLSPEEEAVVLASLDPLSAMATTDTERLDALLREVSVGDAALNELLDKMRPPDLAAEPQPDDTAALGSTFSVVVGCKDEETQTALLDELTERGFQCRALVS
jgi:hypothetical protein